MRERIGHQTCNPDRHDTPEVPWELMIASHIDHDPEPLCVRHPMARWSLEHQGRLQAKLESSPFWTIASGSGDPPEAEREADELVALGARRLSPATRESFWSLVHGSRSVGGILHFAGHGQRDASVSARSTIELDDGTFSALEFASAARGDSTARS